MADICICVLCGLPGSGKTTLCRSIEKSDAFKFFHVCYDSYIPWIDFSEPDIIATWKSYRNEIVCLVERIIRGIVKGKMNENTTESIKLISKTQARKLNDEAHSFINSNLKSETLVVFLIDDNMPYRRMRYEYCQLARKLEVGYCTIMTECAYELCEIRNKRRPLQEIVKQPSLRRIHARMEKPDLSSTNWEGLYSIIDTTECITETTTATCLALLQRAILNPLKDINAIDSEMAEETRKINQKNFRHQADLCLRKLCNEAFKKDSNPKLLVEKITLAKKWILSDVKYGDICEEDYIEQNGAINLEALKHKLEELLTAYLCTDT